MRAIGVTEIVVQWSVDGIAPVHDDAQRVGPLRPALEKVLRAAHDQHMRVTLGLVHDRGYWEKIKGDPEAVRRYFHQLCRVSLATAADVARLDPDRAALSGLYIPQEIDDQSWLEPARQAELLLFLKNLRAGLRTLAPDLPVAVSGFSNGYAAPEAQEGLWRHILMQSGIDRVLFQDGVGVHKLREQEVGLFFHAVARAAASARTSVYSGSGNLYASGRRAVKSEAFSRSSRTAGKAAAAVGQRRSRAACGHSGVQPAGILLADGGRTGKSPLRGI